MLLLDLLLKRVLVPRAGSVLSLEIALISICNKSLDEVLILLRHAALS